MTLQKTPFYEQHVAMGGQMVDFHGWELPLHYGSMIEEHNWVRENAGLFDVAHMGKFLFSGEGVVSFLEYITPSSTAKVPKGKAFYSVLMEYDASAIDDIILYHLGDRQWLMVVNAANRDKDFAVIKERLADPAFAGVKLEEVTFDYTQVALQGPRAVQVLAELWPNIKELFELSYFYSLLIPMPHSLGEQQDHDISEQLLVSRTGYTGEDGYEIYGPFELMQKIWDGLVAHEMVRAIGLGARDSLRLEARYPLYGQELAPGRSILLSGLSWVVNWQKGDFVGRKTLAQEIEAGIKNRLFGYVLEGGGVPRSGYKVLNEQGEEIAAVTSGCFSPSLKKGIFIALFESKPLDKVFIVMRGRQVSAKRVKGPFVPNRTLGGKAGFKQEESKQEESN